MIVIGLTGGIGSGKSTVASLFADAGVEIIDADALAREVVAKGSDVLAQIAEHFGAHVLDENGALRRSELRRIVFSDEHERIWLETLLHPLIAGLMRARIADCQSSYCLVESPLLLETDQQQLVDRVLVVDVPEETQLERALRRDGSDSATIKAIIASQMPRADRLRKADDVIQNENGVSELRAAVKRLHANYLALARESK